MIAKKKVNYFNYEYLSLYFLFVLKFVEGEKLEYMLPDKDYAIVIFLMLKEKMMVVMVNLLFYRKKKKLFFFFFFC